MAITLDQNFPVVFQVSANTVVSGAVTTTANRLLLAVVVANATSANQGESPVTVAGGGLTWIAASEYSTGALGASNFSSYAAIWIAWTTAGLTNQTITATVTNSQNQIRLAIYSLAGTINGSSNILSTFGFIGGITSGISTSCSYTITNSRSTSLLIIAVATETINGGLIRATNSTLKDSGLASSLHFGRGSYAGSSILLGLNETSGSTSGVAIAALEILAAATTYSDTITEVSTAVDSVPSAGNPLTCAEDA